MNPLPFEGLVAAPNGAHAAWVVAAMAEQSGVAHVVPSGFDAYLRVHHPLDGGVRWAKFAPEFLVRGTTAYTYPYDHELLGVEGSLAAPAVDVLGAMLAEATTTPEQCHFGLWNGWGELHGSATSSYLTHSRWRRPRWVRRKRASAMTDQSRSFLADCPTQDWWGGRGTWLFDGPVDRVVGIGGAPMFGDHIRRRSPQWWWPNDRAWFVATEIDYPWTYVAGSVELIATVQSMTELETVRISPTDLW